MKLTPAALNAALSGDMENFMVAATPGGIEAQEKRGQIEQSFLETLPKDGTVGGRVRNNCHKEQFEKLGFVFGKEVDDIFLEAKFPKGWRKKPTDHSMWSEIIDDKGRKRGMIFYKAAFYDRSAHVHLESRFSVSDNYADKNRVVRVVDASGKVQKEIKVADKPTFEQTDNARKELSDWLTKEFPDWQSPLAYWE